MEVLKLKVRIKALTVLGLQALRKHLSDSKKLKNRIALKSLGVTQILEGDCLYMNFGGVYGAMFNNPSLKSDGLLNDFKKNIKKAFDEEGAEEFKDYKIEIEDKNV